MAKASKKQKNRLRKQQLCAMILLALPVLQAQANTTTYTWLGTKNNDFYNNANWSEQVVVAPNTWSTYFKINIQSPNSPVWTSNYNNSLPGNGQIDYLMIGEGARSNGKLVIQRAGTDSSSAYVGSVQVGTNKGTGQLDIRQNTNLAEYDQAILHTQDLTIGSGSGSSGVVNVLGKGKSLQTQGYSGANFTANGAVHVGEAGGQGQIDVYGAGFSMSYGDLNVGSGVGSQGQVNVLGGGKISHGIMGNPQIAVLGDAGGQGRLTISGKSATGDISRAHMGIGLTLGNGRAAFGQERSLGVLRVEQGGELLTYSKRDWGNPIQLGVDGGIGEATIDGAGSIWIVAGEGTVMNNGWTGSANENSPGLPSEMHVGASGIGELTVANGGKLIIGEVYFTDVPIYDEEGNQISHYKHYTEVQEGTGTLYVADAAGSKGIVNIGAPQGRTPQGTGILAVKDIQFGDGIGDIVFNHTDQTGKYEFDTPLISGAGQSRIWQVAGVTTFNTDQNQFTGITDVLGGVLVANARLDGTKNVSGGVLLANTRLEGSVNVSGTGTLAGTGSVGATTVNAGGIISPGASLGNTVGTLEVDSLIFNAGSTYLVQAEPPREFRR